MDPITINFGAIGDVAGDPVQWIVRQTNPFSVAGEATMQRRIEVTNSEGNPIYVNTDYIVWVRPVKGNAEGPAKILAIAGEV